MDSLDRTSSLYQRYAEILSNQENTLASCSQTMDNLKKQETEKRKAIDDFLANLEVE
jgi:menaquinone-dependent protoporphyrinogen IX oxidase